MIENAGGNSGGRMTNRIAAQVTYVILMTSFDESPSLLQEFYMHLQQKDGCTKCQFFCKQGALMMQTHKNGVQMGFNSTSFTASKHLTENLCLSGNVREFWASK